MDAFSSPWPSVSTWTRGTHLTWRWPKVTLAKTVLPPGHPKFCLPEGEGCTDLTWEAQIKVAELLKRLR